MARRGVLRARWWLAALATGALVSCAGQRLRAQCAPDTACQYSAESDTFFINGKRLHFTYSPCTLDASYSACALLHASCAAGALAAWPRFPRPVRFDTVTLRGCALHENQTYFDALEELNIIVNQNLQLLDVPPDSALSVSALLSSSAAPALARLVVSHAAVALPPRAGTAALVDAALSAMPLIDGLNSQRAVVLFASPALAGALGFVAVLAGDVVDVCWLEQASLPTGFLRRARGLSHFSAASNKLSSLPADLFSYSPNLIDIDLSYNLLETLPSDLFSGLVRVQTLRLSSNRLRADGLRVMAPLRALRALWLSDNPLGDLTGSDLSTLCSLPSLQDLALSQTSATRLPSALLRGARALRTLSFDHNALTSVACAELREWPGLSSGTCLYLYGNPLERVRCTQDDYNYAVRHNNLPQGSRLWLEPPRRCDCGVFWLKQTWSRSSVYIVPRDGDNCSYSRCEQTDSQSN